MMINLRGNSLLKYDDWHRFYEQSECSCIPCEFNSTVFSCINTATEVKLTIDRVRADQCISEALFSRAFIWLDALLTF